jgi:hypothetical protein
LATPCSVDSIRRSKREPLFDPERFVLVQDADDSYITACAQIRAGEKRLHWIWYVFLQMARRCLWSRPRRELDLFFARDLSQPTMAF